MSDFVCAAWLSRADLEALLQTPPAAFDWQILEGITEVSCQQYSGVPDLARFGTGRVFGAACELRWQQEGNTFHTVLIGDLQPPVLLTQHQVALTPNDYQTDSTDYFVWGEWSGRDQRWLEATIPHVMSYPAPPNPQGHWRQQIRAVRYFCRNTQQVAFYRLVAMKEEAV